MKRCQYIMLVTLLLCTACSHHHSALSPVPPEQHDTSGTTVGMENHTLAPPVAITQSFSRTEHGIELEDEYHWLTDKSRSNPEVIAYLEAENDYTNSMLEHLQPVKDGLFKEMIGRMKETDRYVPTQRDDYYYYSRTEEGLQYEIMCRRKGSLDAPEEITLNINEIAEGHEYTYIETVRYSPDHKYIAYTVDHSGNERYELFVKELETDDIVDQGIWMDSSLEWSNDSQILFYGDRNTAGENDRLIKRHKLGSDTRDDVLVFEQKLDGYSVGIGKTRDKKYLILGTGSFDSLTCYTLSADNPLGTFKTIHPVEDGVEYSLSGHHSGTFYIVTNADGAQNYKVMTTQASDPLNSEWNVFIPHRNNVTISDFNVFQNYIVVEERKQGMIATRVIDKKTGEDHIIELMEPAYSFESGSNINFETDLFRFWYSSFVTPWSYFEYHMDTREMDLLKQYDVMGGYDPDLYSCQRVFAPAEDGTEIPISIVYRTDMFNNDGSNPLELEAYGAYGDSSDVYFYSSRLTLLDRGIVCAIAHVRGGGEMGKSWHDQAKLMTKKTTFTDFITCAEYLIANGYTRPERLAISGGSAGGTLMGAVMNMRPDLCKLVFADVPSVDVLNSMLDPTLPGTLAHYDEVGNPTDPEMFNYILSYCPYQNVTAQNYPNVFITNGFNDQRVNYWEAAKWTARLRRMKTDDNIILLKTEMAGHFGSSGRYSSIKNLALRYAYMFEVLGVN